jgi:hypothetical protein
MFLRIVLSSLRDSPVPHARRPGRIDRRNPACYLKFQNRRSDYVQTFWNVLNWDVVEQVFQSTGMRFGPDPASPTTKLRRKSDDRPHELGKVNVQPVFHPGPSVAPDLSLLRKAGIIC